MYGTQYQVFFSKDHIPKLFLIAGIGDASNGGGIKRTLAELQVL